MITTTDYAGDDYRATTAFQKQLKALRKSVARLPSAGEADRSELDLKVINDGVVALGDNADMSEKQLRAKSMYLQRIVTSRRSDCISKWRLGVVPHGQRGGGEPQTRFPAGKSWTDADWVEMRFHDPKSDGGEFTALSPWLRVYRVRKDLVENADRLDWFAAMAEYVKRTEGRRDQAESRPGVYLDLRTNDAGYSAPISHTSIAAQIAAFARPLLQRAKFRAHRLRGVVESLLEACGFSVIDFCTRAGHKPRTYVKSYKSAVPLRPRDAWRAHPRRGELRMEEVVFL